MAEEQYSPATIARNQKQCEDIIDNMESDSESSTPVLEQPVQNNAPTASPGSPAPQPAIDSLDTFDPNEILEETVNALRPDSNFDDYLGQPDATLPYLNFDDLFGQPDATPQVGPLPDLLITDIFGQPMTAAQIAARDAYADFDFSGVDAASQEGEYDFSEFQYSGESDDVIEDFMKQLNADQLQGQPATPLVDNNNEQNAIDFTEEQAPERQKAFQNLTDGTFPDLPALQEQEQHIVEQNPCAQSTRSPRPVQQPHAPVDLPQTFQPHAYRPPDWLNLSPEDTERELEKFSAYIYASQQQHR
jgi:hypothetical protein